MFWEVKTSIRTQAIKPFKKYQLLPYELAYLVIELHGTCRVRPKNREKIEWTEGVQKHRRK